MRRTVRVALAAAAVVLVGSVPRVMLAAGVLPDVLRPFVWSDALFVYERGLTGHRLPYVDVPFEYPPLIGVLSGVFSLVMPGPVGFTAAWAVVVAAAAGACAALLADDANEQHVWRSWILTPQLLLLGSVNFDLVPALLLTIAVRSQRARRDVVTLASLALGMAAKLYPGASVPLAWWRTRQRVAATVVFAFVLALVYGPTLFAPFSSAWGLGFYAVGIHANIDSVWGIVQAFLGGVGVPSADVVVVVVTLAGALTMYVASALPRGLRSEDPAVGFCLATLVLMLWSRLYSPQYSLWVLPFFALLGLERGLLALLAVADTGVFLTIYPLTLVPHPPGDPMGAYLLSALVIFVVLRHVALWRVWRAVTRRAAAGSSSPSVVR